MAGDPTAVSAWAGADVFIAPPGTAGPTDLTTPWAAAWDPVGLLDGAEGFVETRDQDVAEHYAWGGLLVRKTISKQKRSIKFYCLEDNDTVFDLLNPGSTRNTATGLTTSTVKTPGTSEFAIGFELRDGTKIKRRSVLRATVSDVGDIKNGEQDLTTYEVTCLIYPEADGSLYTELAGTTP